MPSHRRSRSSRPIRRTERELAGPPPVSSEIETDDYRPETAEELGAKPLPGMYPDAATP